MNPYQVLVENIIMQAVTDYRKAIRGIGVNGTIPPEHTVKEVEQFFKSDWFRQLSTVSGTYIIMKLKEEYEDEVYTH